MPLQEEERLFIDAIRNLNYEAGQLQAEENSTSSNGNSEGSEGSADTGAIDSLVNRKRTLSVATETSSATKPTSPSSSSSVIAQQEASSRRLSALDTPAFRLDSAADAATVLASRLKHSDGTSNAQVESALSWMHAINQRPVSDAPRIVTVGRTADGSQSPSSDRISACNSEASSILAESGIVGGHDKKQKV